MNNKTNKAMNKKNLLLDRNYHVEGNWYAGRKKLLEYKSVVKCEYYDTTSSAGDWTGYFIQKIAGKYFLIMFSQTNNYPNSGFTISTFDVFFEFNSLEEITDLEIEVAYAWF